MKSYNMLMFYYSALLLSAAVKYVDCLECYNCTDVDSVSNCSNTAKCDIGESCYLDLVATGQTKVVNLGCIENQKCGGTANPGPGLIGRDVRKRESETCHECCSTDNCNSNLCKHLKPAACVDSEKVDCAFLNTVANICHDVQHAKTICPKFCNLCDLVDGEWAAWSTWSKL
ncbi:uncharacterized protein LOC132725854 [Ruditapes philippinarum]|uniref:uncharacterized protein LOC132725854 n=1 Tax=Ruditapes philippinarum TaxID=129788 RepID=UPI00295C3754|nr:uncharacterized protein LOC132725854 [Ruditapes philippinarum]